MRGVCGVVVGGPGTQMCGRLARADKVRALLAPWRADQRAWGALPRRHHLPVRPGPAQCA